MTEENTIFEKELSEISGFNIDELIQKGIYSRVYHATKQKTGKKDRYKSMKEILKKLRNIKKH